MSGPYRQVLTQAEIEHKIEDLCDLLGDSIDEYRDILEDAVEKEMTFKRKSHETMIALASTSTVDDGAGGRRKLTVAEKQARVDSYCTDELRDHKLAEARREAAKEGLRSLHTRIDALRTLSANARAAT